MTALTVAVLFDMHDADPILAAEKEAVVARVLASDGFQRLKRARLILSFLFDHDQGDGPPPTQYDIAREVFGRDRDFSADVDSLVRVQVSRLRAGLRDYYQQDGARDAIEVTIPKGTYELRFSRRDLLQQVEIPRSEGEKERADSRFSWSIYGADGVFKLPRLLETNALAVVFLSVLFLTFVLVETNFKLFRESGKQRDLSSKEAGQSSITLARCEELNENDKAAPSEGVSFIASGLMNRLSRSKRVEIISEFNRDGRVAQGGHRYCFDVDLKSVGQEKLLSVRLIDLETKRLVWARNLWTDNEELQDPSMQTVDALAGTIQGKIYEETARRARNKKQHSNTAEELFLMATYVPGQVENNLRWNLERIALAKRALELDPNFAPAHSVLADKMAYLLSFVASKDLPFDVSDAVRHADRALDLGRRDADVVFNIALYNFHMGDMKRSRDMMKRALELAPHHATASILVHGNVCEEHSEKDVAKILSLDRQLDKGEPIRVLLFYMLAGAYLSKGELEQALFQSSKAYAMSRPPFVTLQNAAILTSLGLEERARDIFLEIKAQWPSLDLEKYVNETIFAQCSGANEIAKKNWLTAYQALLAKTESWSSMIR